MERKKLGRVLLKLSGESLAGREGHGIDPVRLEDYARQVKEVADSGVQVAIVIGGGNIFRGLQGATEGFDRIKGDRMGMLATVINSIAVSSALESLGQAARVLTATPMMPVAEYYRTDDAVKAMERGEVVIVAGGTGNPYFTTDTGSALRAIELGCEVMLKGTRVDGVYTADPEKDPTATRYTSISYAEVLDKKLRVMDLTATALCMDNHMPIIVFDMDMPGNLKRVVAGEPVGTLVH